MNLLDIYNLDNSYRLIVRDAADFNKYCLISLGSGESSGPFSGKELRDYLGGKNPLEVPFDFFKNAKDIFVEHIEGFQQNLADITVSLEDQKPHRHISIDPRDMKQADGENRYRKNKDDGEEQL